MRTNQPDLPSLELGDYSGPFQPDLHALQLRSRRRALERGAPHRPDEAAPRASESEPHCRWKISLTDTCVNYAADPGDYVMKDGFERDADCVVYAPRIADADEVCALLRAGKNVVCPPFLLHRTPGLVGVVLPVALSGMSRALDHIRIEEGADRTFCDSPRITFDNMRFGHSPGETTREANPFARFNAELFEQQVWVSRIEIEALCEARPGWRSSLDLGPVHAGIGFRHAG